MIIIIIIIIIVIIIVTIIPTIIIIIFIIIIIIIINPFTTMGSPFDEYNRLALDIVKSPGVRQSKISKSPWWWMG